MQPVTNTVHDRLKTPDVTMPIFPGNERRDLRSESLNHGWSECHPITTVNQYAKIGCSSDAPVVLKQPLLVRLRIVRRECKQSISAGLFSSLCHFNAETLSKTNSSDHRHTSFDRMFRQLNHTRVLRRCQRIHFAGATCSYDCGDRVLDQFCQILVKAGQIKRQVVLEWCDRESNDT